MKRAASPTNDNETSSEPLTKRQIRDHVKAIGKQIRSKYAKKVYEISDEILGKLEQLEKIDQEMLDEAQDLLDTRTGNQGGFMYKDAVCYDMDNENDMCTYDTAGQLFASIRYLAEEHFPRPITIDLSTEVDAAPEGSD